MRSAREATGEFQKLVDFRGGGPLTPYYALAHLGLARSQALAGETARQQNRPRFTGETKKCAVRLNGLKGK